MTIDSRWIQKDFKQKYYLFCREKKIEQISLKKVAPFNNNDYICRITITEL